MGREREAYLVLNGDGRWAAFARGHDIPPDEVQQIADQQLSGDGPAVATEHYFWKRHLKNCGDHDAPCDFEGEFHHHFTALRPNDDVRTHWTEVIR